MYLCSKVQSNLPASTSKNKIKERTSICSILCLCTSQVPAASRSTTAESCRANITMQPNLSSFAKQSIKELPQSQRGNGKQLHGTSGLPSFWRNERMALRNPLGPATAEWARWALLFHNQVLHHLTSWCRPVKHSGAQQTHFLLITQSFFWNERVLTWNWWTCCRDYKPSQGTPSHTQPSWNTKPARSTRHTTCRTAWSANVKACVHISTCIILRAFDVLHVCIHLEKIKAIPKGI